MYATRATHPQVAQLGWTCVHEHEPHVTGLILSGIKLWFKYEGMEVGCYASLPRGLGSMGDS